MSASLTTAIGTANHKYYFAGNLPHLHFTGIDPDDGMIFKVNVWTGAAVGAVILDEIIYPNAVGAASVKIRSAINSYLKTQIPSSDNFHQDTAYTEIRLQFGGFERFFYVIKGGLLIPEADYETHDYLDHFEKNLLTWMPSVRNVKYYEPNYINYFVGPSHAGGLYMTYYYQQWQEFSQTWGFPEQVEVQLYASASTNRLVTFNIGFDKIVSIVNNSQRRIYAFDVYYKVGSDVVSNEQRFLLEHTIDEFDDVFLYENSLGGIETIRFTGNMAEKENHEPKAYLDTDNRLVEFETIFNRLYEKHTGYFDTEEQRLWLREFYTSAMRYHYRMLLNGPTPERITITEVKADSVQNKINSFQFTFRYANPVAWQRHLRETLPNMIDDSVEIEDDPAVRFGQWNQEIAQVPENEET